MCAIRSRKKREKKSTDVRVKKREVKYEKRIKFIFKDKQLDPLNSVLTLTHYSVLNSCNSNPNQNF